jgi:hypothetical protein
MLQDGFYEMWFGSDQSYLNSCPFEPWLFPPDVLHYRISGTLRPAVFQCVRAGESQPVATAIANVAVRIVGTSGQPTFLADIVPINSAQSWVVSSPNNFSANVASGVIVRAGHSNFSLHINLQDVVVSNMQCANATLVMSAVVYPWQGTLVDEALHYLGGGGLPDNLCRSGTERRWWYFYGQGILE